MGALGPRSAACADSRLSMKPAGRLVSVFGVKPSRIGGGEVFAQALSARLAARGWESVLCYESLPEGEVRRFLELPNVTFDVLTDAWKFAARPAGDLAAILKRHPADILHLYFTGFLSPYPWVARWRGVKKVFFTDQGSHPEGYVATRRPAWKRLAARALNLPLNQVICISDYNVECMLRRDLIDAGRVSGSTTAWIWRRPTAMVRRSAGVMASPPACRW